MIDLKPFRQRAGFCGPASVKMVLEHYGIHISEKKLVKMSGTSRDKGVEAEDLVKAVKKLGLKTFFKENSTLTELEKYVNKKKIPVIVDWFSHDFGHFSVVVGIDRENVYLQDPSLGHMRALTIRQMRTLWFDFYGDYPKTKEDFMIRRMIVIFPPPK